MPILIFLLFLNLIYTVYALYKRSKQPARNREYWLAVIIVGMLYGFILVGIHHKQFIDDVSNCLRSMFGRGDNTPASQSMARIFYSQKNQTTYQIAFDGTHLRVNSQIHRDGSPLWVQIINTEVEELNSIDDVVED
jgi:hypothetical protein